MNYVYILRDIRLPEEIIGAITDFRTASRWSSSKNGRYHLKVELNSPELLNRIAKESNESEKK